MVEDKDDEEWDELESEVEEFPLTFFAHREIASSSFAAIAPKGLAGGREAEDEDEDENDIIEGAVSSNDD